MSDDLPTFDLPIKANSGNFALGLSLSCWLLPAKTAVVILIFPKFVQMYKRGTDLSKKHGKDTKDFSYFYEIF